MCRSCGAGAGAGAGANFNMAVRDKAPSSPPKSSSQPLKILECKHYDSLIGLFDYDTMLIRPWRSHNLDADARSQRQMKDFWWRSRPADGSVACQYLSISSISSTEYQAFSKTFEMLGSHKPSRLPSKMVTNALNAELISAQM